MKKQRVINSLIIGSVTTTLTGFILVYTIVRTFLGIDMVNYVANEFSGFFIVFVVWPFLFITIVRLIVEPVTILVRRNQLAQRADRSLHASHLILQYIPFQGIS